MGFKMLLILVSSDLLVYLIIYATRSCPRVTSSHIWQEIFSVYLLGQRESYDFTKVPALTIVYCIQSVKENKLRDPNDSSEVLEVRRQRPIDIFVLHV